VDGFIEDVQPVLLQILLFALVHRKAVGLIDGCRTKVFVIARRDGTRGLADPTPDTPGAHLDFLPVFAALAVNRIGSIAVNTLVPNYYSR
jgi:hypothetical protein